MSFSLPTPPDLDDPMLGFRFGVFFLGKFGVDHPLDFRFQSIDGMSVTVNVKEEGGTGANVSNSVLPQGLSYSNLTLKRGKPLMSTLTMEIQKSLDEFKFSPRNILISILDENGLPINSYLFSEAFPIKWSLSGIDATNNAVLIEEMELRYQSFKPFLL